MNSKDDSILRQSKNSFFQSKGIISFLITQEELSKSSIELWERELGSLAKENNYNAEFLIILSESSNDKFSILSKKFPDFPTQIVLYNGTKGWDQDILQLIPYANGDLILTITGELNSQKKIIENILINSPRCDISVLTTTHSKGNFRSNIIAHLLKNNFKDLLPSNISKSILISRNAANLIVREIDEFRSIYEIFFFENLTYKAIEHDNSNHKILTSYRIPNNQASYLIFNYSNIPIQILTTTFLFNLAIFISSSLNAIIVKLFNHNIFGYQESQVKGWASIVIIISFGFLSITTMLFVGLKAFINEKRKIASSKRSSRKVYRF